MADQKYNITYEQNKQNVSYLRSTSYSRIFLQLQYQLNLWSLYSLGKEADDPYGATGNPHKNLISRFIRILFLKSISISPVLNNDDSDKRKGYSLNNLWSKLEYGVGLLVAIVFRFIPALLVLLPLSLLYFGFQMGYDFACRFLEKLGGVRSWQTIKQGGYKWSSLKLWGSLWASFLIGKVIMFPLRIILWVISAVVGIFEFLNVFMWPYFNLSVGGSKEPFLASHGDRPLSWRGVGIALLILTVAALLSFYPYFALHGFALAHLSVMLSGNAFVFLFNMFLGWGLSTTFSVMAMTATVLVFLAIVFRLALMLEHDVRWNIRDYSGVEKAEQVVEGNFFIQWLAKAYRTLLASPIACQENYFEATYDFMAGKKKRDGANDEELLGSEDDNEDDNEMSHEASPKFSSSDDFLSIEAIQKVFYPTSNKIEAVENEIKAVEIDEIDNTV